MVSIKNWEEFQISGSIGERVKKAEDPHRNWRRWYALTLDQVFLLFSVRKSHLNDTVFSPLLP